LATLGMRNIFGSNLFLSSIYQYSYVIELELSSYVTCLAYRTLCLIVHTTYMVRIRAKVEVADRRAFGLAHVLTCQSVGLESQGDMGSFLCT